MQVRRPHNPLIDFASTYLAILEMGKKSRKGAKGGGGGGGGGPKRARGNAGFCEGGHKIRRKRKREEERRLKKEQKKLRKEAAKGKAAPQPRNARIKNTFSGRKDLGKTRVDVMGGMGGVSEVDFTTRDSSVRKGAMRRKLRIKQLENEVQQEESALRAFSYGVQNVTDVESRHVRNREDMRRRTEVGVLRGAARPASEVYPWLYEDDKPKFDNEEFDTIDMIKECSPRCSYFCTTRKLVARRYRLALEHMQGDSEASWVKACQSLRVICESIDSANDALGGRILLIRSLLEVGEVGEARKVVQKDISSSVNETDVLWSKAMIDYVSWTVGDQKGGKERSFASLKAAHAANPFVSFALVHIDDLVGYMNPAVIEDAARQARESCLKDLVSLACGEDADVETFIKDARRFGTCSGGASARGSLGEAAAYAVMSATLWRSSEGAEEWIRNSLELPMSVALPKVSDADIAVACASSAGKEDGSSRSVNDDNANTFKPSLSLDALYRGAYENYLADLDDDDDGSPSEDGEF